MTKTSFLSLILAGILLSCSPAVRNQGEVEVDFLWVRKADNGRKLEGGTSHAILKVESSKSGMSVGVFESKPGGTGQMWRAAIWVAALTGTLDILKNPQDYRYSVETETLTARVDGPSAGGLFAVAVMAALSGDRIDELTTMTGSINPDGSIGPVGGVSAKLDAAAAIGKKRFCFPMGQRFDKDPVSGNSIDILERAEVLNVEVTEVADLRQAYECLVRKNRKAIAPVRRSAMALTGEMFDLMKSMTERWLADSQEAYSASRKLVKDKRFEPFWEGARNAYEDAQDLLKQGLVAAAYWRAVSAYVNARTVLLAAAMVGRLSDGDPVEALKIFSTMEEDSQKRLDKVFAALANEVPDTVSRSILLLDAYEAAITALVSREFARARYGDILRRMKGSIEAGKDFDKLVLLFAELHQPLGEIALVEINGQLALDNIEISRIASKSRKTRLSRIEEVARLFQGAATANVEYFDAIFVREVAEKANKPMEIAAAALLDKEPGYRTAQFNLKLPESGKMGYAEEGLPSSLAKLAGALSSFFASSTLVAKFYSIGVRLDQNGNTVGVEREKALISTLSQAEEKARKNGALALKYTGEIPPSAQIEYQIAMVLRERPGYSEKLEALEHFWRSSVWSQVAVYLARLESGEGR